MSEETARYRVDMSKYPNMMGGELGNEDNMDKFITQQVKRKVAKCLDDLGNSVSPSTQRTIKHWFWILADDLKDDIKQGKLGEQNDNTDQDRFNR